MKLLSILLVTIGSALGFLVCDGGSLCDSVQTCSLGLTCSNINSMGIGECCIDDTQLTTASLYTLYPLNPLDITQNPLIPNVQPYTYSPYSYNTLYPQYPNSQTGCQDLLNPLSGISDCASRISLCNDINYYDLMTRQCPKSCGRCGQYAGSSVPNWLGTTPFPISSTNCVDRVNPKTGISDCPGQFNLCNDSLYRNLMRSECPRTCGVCNGLGGGLSSTINFNNPILMTSTPHFGSCVDQINPRTGNSDCQSMSFLCSRSDYTSLMRSQCPRTCGLCQ